LRKGPASAPKGGQKKGNAEKKKAIWLKGTPLLAREIVTWKAKGGRSQEGKKEPRIKRVIGAQKRGIPKMTNEC